MGYPDRAMELAEDEQRAMQKLVSEKARHTPGVREQRPAEGALEDVDSAIERLGSTLDQLSSRLEPVSSARPAESDQSANPNRGESPLLKRMAAQREQLDNLTARAIRMIHALEI